MAYTCKVTLSVTDENTEVETLATEHTERNVSVRKMLELEDGLLELTKGRLEAQAKKMLSATAATAS